MSEGTMNGTANGKATGPINSESGLPPTCIEVEERLLGAIMLDPAVLAEVVPLVSPADFFRDAHEALARVFWDRFAEGRPIDLATVDEELTRDHGYKGTEATSFLCELMDKAVHSASAVHHAQVVQKKAVTRDLYLLGEKLQIEARSNRFTAEELVSHADNGLFDLAARLTASDVPCDTPEGIDSVFVRLDERREEVRHGIATGFGEVDKLVGCLRDANLTVLAARPAIGKTALALNIAEHVAFTQDIPTLFFSLEMERDDLYERLLSSRSGVSGSKLQSPSLLNDHEIRAIGAVRGALTSGKLAVDDCPSRTVAQLAAVARLHQKRQGLGFVVIDYLSLIDGQPRKGESRQEEVARTTRGLKTLARTLNVPILLLCQLNREVEKRGDGRPRLADLRESGQIEQEASVVLMLHRNFDDPGAAEILVAKNRFGQQGIVKLAFRRECTRFENLALPGQIAAEGEREF